MKNQPVPKQGGPEGRSVARVTETEPSPVTSFLQRQNWTRPMGHSLNFHTGLANPDTFCAFPKAPAATRSHYILATETAPAFTPRSHCGDGWAPE